MYAACVTAELPARQKTLYEAGRVSLRRLMLDDEQEFIRLTRASAELFGPWVRLPDDAERFRHYLSRFDRMTAECLLICVRETGAIAGVVGISEIIRGHYQRATVGYNAFSATVRQGYMSEGFKLVLRFAFEDLCLHRLEADIQPANAPSLRFAEKMGFRKEGFSPAFIYIDGRWHDHERWAILSDRSDYT